MSATHLTLMILGICVLGSNARGAEDVCVEAGNKGYGQINAAYDPKIDLFLKVAGGLKEKGFDPHKYPVINQDGTIDVVDIADTVIKLANQKATGYKQVSDAVDGCNKKFEVPQKITDIAVFISTSGLSAVLPAQMTHIDVSQITKGTLFGGPNALIPKLRDQALDGLGIGGDVACIIRDPKKIFGGC